MKIFIMGCHRSGTSLVTGLLHHCGLYLGNNLLMGAKDNPKGHFEDRRFIGINNQLLLTNGGTWRRPPAKIIINPDIARRAKRLLNLFPKDKIVGFKDPRVCLTFHFWHNIIVPEPIKVVFVHRPTSEIASSLKERNEIPIGMGKKLANIYNWRAAVNIEKTGVEAYEVHFHDFFKPGWKVKLCYLCSVLGLKYPKNPSRIIKFVDERFWHHRK